MLDWKHYKTANTNIDAVPLTRENMTDLTGYLMEHDMVVGGALGGASLSAPVFLTVNGARANEGDYIFARHTDGAIGILPPEKITCFTLASDPEVTS